MRKSATAALFGMSLLFSVSALAEDRPTTATDVTKAELAAVFATLGSDRADWSKCDRDLHQCNEMFSIGR